VANEDNPLGVDLCPDLLEIRDVALEGIVSRVVEPRRSPAAHLIVDVDVEAVTGEPPEIACVALHIRNSGAAVEEDDGRYSGATLGGNADVGDPGASRKFPEALALNGSGRQARISHRKQGRPREDADDQGGAGTERSHANASLAES